jgi:hypothetical protein
MGSRWISEYEKCMISGEIDNAEKIKNEHIKKSFFKYRHFDAELHWIDWVKGDIYASSPKSFNDPFDCMLTLSSYENNKIINLNILYHLDKHGELTCADRKKLLSSDKPYETLEEIRNNYSNLSDESNIEKVKTDMEIYKKSAVDKYKDHLRVLCLSEKNDSILMWSHYADNHKGLCIEYVFDEHPDIVESLYPVVYTDKRPMLSKSNIESNKEPMHTILCKSPDWSYEKEWRYIAIKQPYDDTPFHLSAPKSIKTIYLGVDAKKHYPNCVEILMELAQTRGVPVHEMKFDETKYRLTSHKLD